MSKKQQQRIIEAICVINLVLLIGMLVLTSYGPWFNERAAVVASLLWLFSIIPALAVAVYGIVSANKKSRKSRLLICWTTLVANVAVTAFMFLLR